MKIFIIALITYTCICSCGCKSAHHESDNIPDMQNHGDEIIFTKAQAANTDFKVEEIQPDTFYQVIKTTGQILPAIGDESAIVATHGGIISYAHANLSEGSAVKPNVPLFYIVSKNMEAGDYYARTIAEYDKAKTEYERAETLMKDQIISRKEFESIQLNYRRAKTAFESISGKKSDRGIEITAPMSGFLKNIAVKDGEYVNAGQTVATVSQNKKLALRADVSEKYYASLNSIHSANFKTPYDNRVYALAELSGKLISVGKAVADDAFSIPMTFEFDNRGEIIPGSFVEIYLLSKPMTNVLSLPLSALTNEMGHFYVYKQADEESYQKQEVKIGASNGNEVQILSGITPGDRIVTQGAYQVKIASSATAIPEHSHEH